MILLFPNLDTLRFALMSGAVPAKISTTAVRAASAGDGRVWIEPSAKISNAVQKQLHLLNVQTVLTIESPDVVDYSCWPALLPLQQERELKMPTAQTAVMFLLPQTEMLPVLAGEMLRLGNDRQSFRYLEQEGAAPQILLRVYGPPYYSLLRALDGDGQQSPRAFVESAPRIWVEIGYSHPLIDALKPPDDQLLFMLSHQEWLTLNDAPFQDVYDILEFQLPHGPVHWHDLRHQDRLTVPLHLARGDMSNPAELWVIRKKPMQQMESLIRNASDALLARLSFAVATAGEQEAVILRVRPSRQRPPVLVLDAPGFRPFLKLPNLFVPCGSVLHPPLRRDVVRKLLADDPEKITWLLPHDDGTFTPENLPDRIFRPLPDWIDYVLTRESAALHTWMDSSLFDFERFVCTDDQKSTKKKKRSKAIDESVAVEITPNIAAPPIKKKKKMANPDDAALHVLPEKEPDELQLQQRALEQQFLAAEGGLDAPERQALWPELAKTYAAQKSHTDAAICWANALWDEPEESPLWARLWRQCNQIEFGGKSPPAILDHVLAESEPATKHLRAVAAILIDAAAQGSPPAYVVERLGHLQPFLQKYDKMLSVRAFWLAARSQYEVSGGDVLALARARDQLLERLFQSGLTMEQDLPSFLRFTGTQSNDRFSAFRDWLSELPKKVHHWISKVNRPSAGTAIDETAAYATLILAFGFARLGETEKSQTLHRRASKILVHRSEIHTVLLEAFGYRVEQAASGASLHGSLPDHLLEYLEKMDRLERYAVDRLRQHSNILEPHEKINPYRAWHTRYGDALSRKLAGLPDIIEKHQLETEIHSLFQAARQTTKKNKKDSARVLRSALELAPRIGEGFAVPLLAEVFEAEQQFPDLFEKADLLEKALFVAAHFDQPSYVQDFVTAFQKLLQSQSDARNLPQLDSLAGQCFRGLRKLGMRESIDALLSQFKNAILQGQSMSERRGQSDWPSRLQSLLHVAAGWFYFGMDKEGQTFIDEARRLLLHGDLDRLAKRKLVIAYVKVLGQAPAALAMSAIDELLSRLGDVQDTFTTNKYFGLSQLDVVEAVVLAVVTEDFASGSQTRHWLDDEEYLVRQRIHHDFKTALAQHE